MRPSSSQHRSADGVARLLTHRWAAILGVWMVPALLAAFETYIFWRLGGRDYPLWRAVVMESPAWLVYAAATPLVLSLARRLPIQSPHLARNLAIHLVLSQVAGAAYVTVATAFSTVFTPVPRAAPFGKVAFSWFLSALPLTTLTYFGILGAGAALVYLAEARRRETEAARLGAQLAEARLGALQMQLHPHFLFNTLNAVTVLARDGETSAVVRMLTLLSELLRDVLRADRAQSIPLDEELAFARRYLEIELVRFADRLRYRESIDDALGSALVPAFILQPLIENALRHGIAPRAEGGTIEVGARRHGGALELSVHDDGVGLRDGWSGDDYGIGLSNVAARLRELYGADGTLRVTREPAGGTRAVVTLPLRIGAGVAATDGATQLVGAT